MKKRTKEEAIEKDPLVNDLKVPNEVQRENRKVHGNGSIRPLFVHSKFSTSAALAKRKKKTLAKKRERKKKLRETDASSYVSRSLSLSLSHTLSLHLFRRKAEHVSLF